MKYLDFNIALKSINPQKQTTRPKIFTNDLDSVMIRVTVTDMTDTDLLGSSAEMLLYMQDRSFFQNSDVTREGNVFKYILKENEGNHAGIARLQLPVKTADGKTYAQQKLEFEIESGLETKVATEVMIHDWTTLTREAKAYIDEFQLIVNSAKEQVQANIVETAVEEKFNNLEQEYAEDLTEVKTQLAENMKKINHIVNVSDFGVLNTSITADQSIGIQQAIDYVANLGGGTVQFNNATYYCQGLIPRNNITLQGTGRTTLKLVIGAINHLINYKSESTIDNFNLYNITLDGNDQPFDLIHIEDTLGRKNTYTWHKSVIDNCIIINGDVGIYCTTPGSVKIVNSWVAYNDIGIKQRHEHFYLSNTTLWGNRIGADIYQANHFTWTNAIIAHNSEIGVLCDEVGTSWQNGLIGCSFIDNPYCIKGRLDKFRIIGCRFINAGVGIMGLNLMNIISGCEFAELTSAIEYESVLVPLNNNISSNVFMLNETDITMKGDNHIISSNQFRATKTIPIKTTGTQTGINVQGNHFYDASGNGENLYPCIQINGGLHASAISNNVFRNTGTGKASHGVWFTNDPTKTVSDIIMIGNIARNMKTAGYQIKTPVTQVSNIGTVVTV